MDILLPESRAIATKNRNRNMVLAMFQRVTLEYEQLWAHGLSRFGVAMLFGINASVKAVCECVDYADLPSDAANSNFTPGAQAVIKKYALPEMPESRS